MTREEKCRVIAEKVFGLKIHPDGNGLLLHGGPFNMCSLPIKDYFTDPAAMVALMEKLQNFDIPTMGIILQSWPDVWTAEIYILDKPKIRGSGHTPMEAVAEAVYQWTMIP